MLRPVLCAEAANHVPPISTAYGGAPRAARRNDKKRVTPTTESSASANLSERNRLTLGFHREQLVHVLVDTVAAVRNGRECIRIPILARGRGQPVDVPRA